MQRVRSIPAGSICVRKIEISKDSRYLPDMRKLVAPYEGTWMTATMVNDLVQELTKALWKAGYVTSRVEVPKQNMVSGTLRLHVVAGRIEDIRYKTDRYGTWKTAFPIRKGDVLNLRSLEQGLEQMRAIPNQEVKAKLLPGTKADTSIIELDVKRTKPWDISLSIDDGGHEPTGRLEGSISGNVYNPLGIGDSLSLSYSKDLAYRHTSSAYGTDTRSIAYRMPLGNYTFTLGWMSYKYHQQVAARTPYTWQGETKNISLGVERLLYRDSVSKTSAAFNLIKKDKRSYLDGEEVGVQRQHTTVLELGIKHRRYFGEKRLDLYTYYRQGVPWLGAEQQEWEGQYGSGTTMYHLFGLQGTLLVPLDFGQKRGQYLLRFVGQYTPNTLFLSDQMSLGGRYTVKGFSGDHTLTGESGYYLRNEVTFPTLGKRFYPYVGLDIGHVWGPSTEDLLGTMLVGAYVGVKGQLMNGLYIDGFVGTPVYKPEGFKASKTAFGFSASVTY